ncbi:HAD-IIB family hydrolase [Marinomonas pollencensis]|uniref:Mannosyl-3-phosphoglycerate phosphatase n=1 Tax=Marinomonas pollencensis TaxID=491954 RepID=A0A3E0DU73_9GAMM|nr:HAD-IIB family hydrolase [Marinomonas pollencensis]REG86458.1 mannosyl-3-phosphoglycerate phosphatase [Marinomonas pollencensis]
MTRLLVFSDLDGTLLDHHTYSFQPAAQAFQALKTFTIPCILNTSKTYAELTQLRTELGHKDPFIVENGAAIYIPKQLGLPVDDSLEDHGEFWLKSFGPKRDALLQLISQYKNEYQFHGFSEMQWQDIVALTGLSEEKAKLAMQREFTEPMVWKDSNNALNTLKKTLAPEGIQLQKGGRFVHLMGAECDKARAMLWLTECYQDHFQEAVSTMALGDGENDIGMLSKADIPVVIRSPVHAPPEIPYRSDAWLTDGYGPTGWAQAIDQALIKQGIV